MSLSSVGARRRGSPVRCPARLHEDQRRPVPTRPRRLVRVSQQRERQRQPPRAARDDTPVRAGEDGAPQTCLVSIRICTGPGAKTPARAAASHRHRHTRRTTITTPRSRPSALRGPPVTSSSHRKLSSLAGSGRSRTTQPVVARGRRGRLPSGRRVRPTGGARTRTIVARI